MLEALPQLVAACHVHEIALELEYRSHTTHVRRAYVTQTVAPGLASALKISPAGNVWFGPRTSVVRFDLTWKVADTVLPYHLSELHGVKAHNPLKTEE